MNDLRTAAQQALTEMANARDYIWLLNEGGTGVSEEEILNKIANAITALRAALAEPENWELRRLREELERCKEVCAATSEAWREEAALGCDHCNSPLYAAIKCKVCGRVTEPAPPQRKPLTEEEIDSIWDSEKAFADIYAIARAIERAHGIGGQP